MPQPSSNRPPDDRPDRLRRRPTRCDNGDSTRWRRMADPIRRSYYARYRQERFARRMRGGADSLLPALAGLTTPQSSAPPPAAT